MSPPAITAAVCVVVPLSASVTVAPLMPTIPSTVPITTFVWSAKSMSPPLLMATCPTELPQGSEIDLVPRTPRLGIVIELPPVAVTDPPESSARLGTCAGRMPWLIVMSPALALPITSSAAVTASRLASLNDMPLPP